MSNSGDGSLRSILRPVVVPIFAIFLLIQPWCSGAMSDTRLPATRDSVSASATCTGPDFTAISQMQ
jgi:hypothetical protein